MGQDDRRVRRRSAPERRAHSALVRVDGDTGGMRAWLSIVAPDELPLEGLERAVADALRRYLRAAAAGGAAAALSAREAEVSRLVAAGRSNRDIAPALVIGADAGQKH